MADLPALSPKVNSNYMDEELVSFADDQSEAAASLPTQVSVQIEETGVECRRIQPRILHRVPQQLKYKKDGIYEPVVLSLGPYHNIKSQQKEEFHRVEKFKNKALDIILETTTLKDFFRSKILDRVEEIRMFYGGVSREEHDDDALTEMMVRDACFLFFYMHTEYDYHLHYSLGLSITQFLYRDVYMLENQIPFWVIKLLINIKYDDKDEREAFLCKFLSFICFGDKGTLKRLPWEGEEREPLHPLEANAKALVIEEDISSTPTKHSILKLIQWKCSWRWRKSNQSGDRFESVNSPFRSVTDLKAKGIRFRPVTDLKAKGIRFRPSSYCLTDIRFDSYMFYGVLRIPIRCVTYNTKVQLSNLIAFEMSPESSTSLELIAYVNFMKSLIESPKDVKELREKGILFSTLRNDEEVVKIFKEIDTYGVVSEFIFQDIKMRINEHCHSKSKTWIAELIHTYFHSPWPATALVASIFLLCLTFIQTYYAVHPQKGN